MSLYDYQCNQCENRFEVRASFSEKDQGLQSFGHRCQSVKTYHLLTTGLFIHATTTGGTDLISSGCKINPDREY